MDLSESARMFCSNVVGQFISRTQIEGKKRGVDFGITVKFEMNDDTIWFSFTKGKETHSFSVPLLKEEKSVMLIEQNEVSRAVCPFLMKDEDVALDYYAVMTRILIDTRLEGIISPSLIKKGPFIQQVVWSFENGDTSRVMYNLQRAINEVVNRMPLYETDMNSWVMNRRLIIIDPVFDEIRSPEDRLQYQIDKSKYYFSRGWTPIGLADSNLSDKNYTLTFDIRHLTPFGMRYHNPQRNLYSTLKMKGDELPKIRSGSMQALMDQNITRTGWNLFTLFVDIPDVFEDQIMVDLSHRNKYVKYDKRFQCYGMLRVKEGQSLKRGQTLSIAKDGMVKRFDVDADRAKVKKIKRSFVNVGGVKTEVFNVMVEYRRYLRDGMKFTNLHGNKGIIRMKELGHMIDPRSGETRKIDVIVSGKSIKKRKNFGQVLEALLNNTTPEEQKPIVLADDYEVSMDVVKTVLKANGLPEDGTWAGETYVGPQEGICGEVFWGVSASVESSLWDNGATIRKNTRGLRTAGLKLSHVELRALQTRFGKDNAVLDEILSYAQGSDDLHEYLRILKGKKGEFSEGLPVHHVLNLKYVDQSGGTIVDADAIKGTIVDEKFEPEGFLMQLPIAYQVIRNARGEIEYQGAPLRGQLPEGQVYTYDKLYVPRAALRRCWKHDAAKYGLSELGVLLNNILIMSYRLLGAVTEPRHYTMLYNAIGLYFSRVAKILGTKRGEIAQLGMSIRYPFSTKAIATLCNRLPENTVEIHEEMAKQLRVKNGDVVLVERFPCLGFMSIRPQKIRTTKDEMARYTIRVSGNCLCSLGLDFDGDVIYLASFHTPEAKELLRKEWEQPNAECYDVICSLNNKAGCPTVDNSGLDDYNISKFEDLTAETHAAIVSNATGVKSHTGPVIALAYNMMRILENSHVADDQATNVAIEYFLDRVGNTVFKQKHGVKSLHAIVTEAICCGDVETLVSEGFDRATSQTIVDVIREKAKALRVYDLVRYYHRAKERGWSNIINRIVRMENKIYYASRAQLEGLELLDHLESEAVDIPSKILKRLLSGKVDSVRTKLEEILELEATDVIHNDSWREACISLMDLVEGLLKPSEVPEGVEPKLYRAFVRSMSKKKAA